MCKISWTFPVTNSVINEPFMSWYFYVTLPLEWLLVNLCFLIIPERSSNMNHWMQRSWFQCLHGLRPPSVVARLLDLRVRIPLLASQFLGNVACCHVEVSATGRSLVQTNLTVWVCVYVGLCVCVCVSDSAFIWVWSGNTRPLITYRIR